MTKPRAGVYRTFGGWKKKGRVVNKGEKSKIFDPYGEALFDRTQTKKTISKNKLTGKDDFYYNSSCAEVYGSGQYVDENYDFPSQTVDWGNEF